MKQIDEIGQKYQQLLPASIRKELGSFYTKFEDAWQLSENLLDRVKHPITSILEPSCGGGAFATTIYYGLINRGYDGVNIINNILTCVDIDADAAEITKELLLTLEPSSTPNIIVGDTLLEDLPLFDIIIGNPPYVRVHNLSDEIKKVYRKKFSCYKGFSDLSTAFIQYGLEHLKEKGVLGYINTDSFIRSKAGENIRNLIKPYLAEYDDRDGDKKFTASVSVAFLIISKKESDFKYRGEVMPKEFIGDNEWIFKESSKIEGKTMKDLGIKLSLGIVTGYNKGFISEEYPEADWTRKVVRGRGDKGEKVIYLTEEPTGDALEALLPYKELLDVRTAGKRKWWQLQGYATAINWDLDNWIIKRIGSTFNDFIEVKAGIVCIDTCYVLVTPNTINKDKLVEILQTDPLIKEQFENIMNKLSTKYEIHATKFSRLVLPDKYINIISC